MRTTILTAAFCLCALSMIPVKAEIPNNKLVVGVLTDFSGPFSDSTGKGSFAAAQLAAEDFAKEAGGIKVEIVSADHQNKADIGATIARKWMDVDGVTAIVDLPNSGVALAVISAVKERNRVTLASGSASSDLTGKQCEPTTVQWAWDTWALGNAASRAISGGAENSWFFIGFDYALGKALQRDTAEAVKRQGGTIVGSVSHPLNTADFASYLLQAQSSGAKVIALANTGHDFLNSVKQASEFGLLGNGRKLAALFGEVNEIEGIGLKEAQGLIVSLPFYWDLNDSTRAWTKRFQEKLPGKVPNSNQSATYSATLAYLRAAKAANTIEGEKVVGEMRRATIHDPLYGEVDVRVDGRAIHDFYVFQVKTPAESTGSHDVLKLVQTIPPAEAFRPLDQGGCPLVK